MLVGPDTWGALFLARSGDGAAVDRTDVLNLGFTLFDEATVERAGQTEYYGHGPTSAVISVINDFELKFRMPSFFFLLPQGEVLDASLVQKWTEGGLVF